MSAGPAVIAAMSEMLISSPNTDPGTRSHRTSPACVPTSVFRRRTGATKVARSDTLILFPLKLPATSSAGHPFVPHGSWFPRAAEAEHMVLGGTLEPITITIVVRPCRQVVPRRLECLRHHQCPRRGRPYVPASCWRRTDQPHMRFHQRRRPRHCHRLGRTRLRGRLRRCSPGWHWLPSGSCRTSPQAGPRHRFLGKALGIHRQLSQPSRAPSSSSSGSQASPNGSPGGLTKTSVFV